jgi:hypothetical protein
VPGLSTNWDIGVFSLGGAVNFGMSEISPNWCSGYNSQNASLPVLKTNGKDIADIYTLQAEIVPALKLTDTLRFEAGIGYRMEIANSTQGFSQKDGSWLTYVQAMITLAPGDFLCL